ncbi:hypothetical protein BN946_scf184493.g22 [Trametes cinnabarina]|uniref:Uncharacterized protein n=1 Tax=Pycnoporus cinnabarinus TaxID=5643 RepID=A0A060SU24_PYCCI|nr:hypothetical protein BN946_scf184493.g22 [Trametes cinnabarina]
MHSLTSFHLAKVVREHSKRSPPVLYWGGDNVMAAGNPSSIFVDPDGSIIAPDDTGTSEDMPPSKDASLSGGGSLETSTTSRLASLTEASTQSQVRAAIFLDVRRSCDNHATIEDLPCHYGLFCATRIDQCLRFRQCHDAIRQHIPVHHTGGVTILGRQHLPFGEHIVDIIELDVFCPGIYERDVRGRSFTLLVYQFRVLHDANWRYTTNHQPSSSNQLCILDRCLG